MLHTKEKINKQSKEKSIRSSLMFTVALIFVIMSLIIGNNTYLIAKNSLIKTSQEMMLNKSLDSANIVNSRINMYISNIQPLGILSPLTDDTLSRDEKIEILKSEKNRLDLTGLGYSDFQGNLVLDNGISFNISSEDYFKQSIKGQPYFSQPFFNNHFNKMEIAISAPIYSNGKIIGSVIGFTHADEFYSLASDIKIGDSGFAYLLNEQADIVSHPTVTSSASVSTTSAASTTTETSSSATSTASGTTDASSTASATGGNKIMFSSILDKVSDSTRDNVEEIIENISNKVAGVNHYTENGKTTHLSYAPIMSKGWTLIVNATEDDILRDIDSIKVSLTIIVLFSLAVALALLYFLINKIITAIINITNRTKALADLDLRLPVDNKLLARKDELGTMAKSIQSVIDSIKGFASDTKLSSINLSNSSHELAAITEESYASSTAIAELSTTISANSQDQLSEINIVSDEVEQVLNQFNVALMENKNIENLSSQASINIKDGLEVVNDVMNQMNTIKSTNDNLKFSIDKINNSSKKMNEILSVIQNIAEQTNLLSLNAAIESARAGEAGRGFSVVAEEIRKLSDQTSGSVNQVSDIIRENYNLIKTSNQYMNLTNEEITKGLNKVNNTKNTFDQMNAIISDINLGMHRAKEAIDKVGKSINDVNNSIAVASTISNEVSEEILNISAATQEQMAAMDEVTTSSDNLAKLATDLEEIFKYIKM